VQLLDQRAVGRPAEHPRGERGVDGGQGQARADRQGALAPGMSIRITSFPTFCQNTFRRMLSSSTDPVNLTCSRSILRSVL
jgi:hypothetical protein